MKKFRVGDVVENIETGDRYVVCGSKGWIHMPFTADDGSKDYRISLAREIGAIPLLSSASKYKLLRARETVRIDWWKIFPRGEK